MSWLEDLRDAAMRNARDLSFTSGLVLPSVEESTYLEDRERRYRTRSIGDVDYARVARSFEVRWRRRLPYRFGGPSHRTLSWARCKMRRSAACTDAAAGAAALAFLLGDGVAENSTLCLETSAERPGYAHVRVYLLAVDVDPYREERLAVDRCTARVRVSTLFRSLDDAAAELGSCSLCVEG